MRIKRPIMRYHGGKFRLADTLIQFFPAHHCYVEPFGGAAGVLMRKPPSAAEVYNDLDDEIVNVFRVLRDPDLRDRLIEACALTPYSRTEFASCYEPHPDPVEQARRTLFRAEAGFGSGAAAGYRTGFRPSSKRGGSLPARLWAEYPGQIGRFARRLSGVIIENRPAIDVIQDHDAPNTLFYVDPPYVSDTRKLSHKNGGVYRHEMSDADHEDLLSVLNKVEGLVVLSGYPNPLYDRLLENWECRTISNRVSSNGGSVVKMESVWLNPACAAQQRQQQLFA